MIKTIDVSGVSTSYKLLHPDKSKTIIILHGLRGDHQALLELGGVLNGFKVIIPDLPGHGSSAQLSKHAIRTYAEWFNGFLRALELRDATVIGHSLGANIAMAAICQDQGKRIKKAIHFVMYPKYHNTGINRGVKALYKFGRLLPERVADRALRTRLMSILTIRTMVNTKDKKVAKWIIDDGHRAAQNVSAKVVSEVCEDIEGIDMRDFIDTSVPQMFVITSEDKFSHNEEIKLLSESIKGSELLELDNLGHLAPLEDPKRLVDSIKHWL